MKNLIFDNTLKCENAILPINAKDNAIAIMLECYKSLFLMLFIFLLTIIMVTAANGALPAAGGKVMRAGGHAVNMRRSISTLGFLENHINRVDLRQTQWSKKFLAKREAKPHSAPYVVSIQMLTAEQGLVHYCAGTIINEHWILTAAHCLSSEQSMQNSLIVAGAHDIHNLQNDHNVQLRQIDFHVQHELYLGGVNPYDIALIYTKKPLHFNEYVQAAKLPQQDEQPEGYGTLYGWGNVSMTVVPQYPHKLQEANMPILDMTLCEQILAASGFSLHETNLCTGPLTGGVSICTADSGGPLIQQQQSNMAYEEADDDYFDDMQQIGDGTIIGIVSWGKMPCGQKNAPSVFVRVSAFTDWIQQVINTATIVE